MHRQHSANFPVIDYDTTHHEILCHSSSGQHQLKCFLILCDAEFRSTSRFRWIFRGAGL